MLKESKVVFSPIIARRLIKQGFQVVDIKPNNRNPVASVFFFKDSITFEDELHAMINNYQE